MKTGRLPWSWIALGVAMLSLGAVFAAGFFLSGLFRSGLDADMNRVIFAAGPFEIIQLILCAGFVGLPFVVLGWWISRHTTQPRRIFLTLTPAIPTLIFISFKAWFIIGAALDEPIGIAPFEQDNSLYLPNWLDAATVGASFLTATMVYLLIARASAQGR